MSLLPLIVIAGIGAALVAAAGASAHRTVDAVAYGVLAWVLCRQLAQGSARRRFDRQFQTTVHTRPPGHRP